MREALYPVGDEDALAALRAIYRRRGPARPLRTLLELRERHPFAGQILGQVCDADPNTAIRLRRIASAFPGGPRRVLTLRDAIREAGYRAVYCNAVICSLVGALNPRAREADWHPYWRRATTTAVLAQAIADVEEVHRDHAFAAALLANLGDLLLPVHFPDQARLAQERGGNADAAEREVLDYTRRELATALAEHWELPAHFVEAIAHEPCACGEQEGAAELYALVDRARRAADACMRASTASLEELLPDEQATARALEALGGLFWLKASSSHLLFTAVIEGASPVQPAPPP